MTENKSYADSFRIRNYEDQLASVWQIGSGDFFAVKFDVDEEPIIYTQKQIANAFNDRYWEIASDEPVKEESLPRTFKFKCAGNDECIYTFTQTDGKPLVTWSGGTCTVDYYAVETARKFIKEGTWILLPSEPETHSAGSQNVPFDSYTANLHNGEEYLQKDLIEKLHKFGGKINIIQRIKSATQNYDMTISLDSGTYHIYDNLCDLSYKADTDEKLIEILDCIDFLSGCSC